MGDEPRVTHPVPIREGAHPLRRAWRGASELAQATLQALLALSEIFRPRYDATDPAHPPANPPEQRPRRRRRGLHPVQKAAPFPIND